MYAVCLPYPFLLIILLLLLRITPNLPASPNYERLTVEERLDLRWGGAVGQAPQLDEGVHLDKVLLVHDVLELVDLSVEN